VRTIGILTLLTASLITARAVAQESGSSVHFGVGGFWVIPTARSLRGGVIFGSGIIAPYLAAGFGQLNESGLITYFDNCPRCDPLMGRGAALIGEADLLLFRNQRGPCTPRLAGPARLSLILQAEDLALWLRRAARSRRTVRAAAALLMIALPGSSRSSRRDRGSGVLFFRHLRLGRVAAAAQLVVPLFQVKGQIAISPQVDAATLLLVSLRVFG